MLRLKSAASMLARLYRGSCLCDIDNSGCVCSGHPPMTRLSWSPLHRVVRHSPRSESTESIPNIDRLSRGKNMRTLGLIASIVVLIACGPADAQRRAPKQKQTPIQPPPEKPKKEKPEQPGEQLTDSNGKRLPRLGTIDPYKFSTGESGYFRVSGIDFTGYMVLSVPKNGDAIVKPKGYITITVAKTTVHGTPYTVPESRPADGQPIWLTGIDTSNFTTGKMVQLTRAFTITGTTTYNTAAGGTNTIYVAKAVDMRPYEEAAARERKRDADEQAERDASRAAAQADAVSQSTASVKATDGPDTKPGWWKVTLTNPTQTTIDSIEVEIVGKLGAMKTVTFKRVKPGEKSLTFRLMDGVVPTSARVVFVPAASQQAGS